MFEAFKLQLLNFTEVFKLQVLKRGRSCERSFRTYRRFHCTELKKKGGGSWNRYEKAMQLGRYKTIRVNEHTNCTGPGTLPCGTPYKLEKKIYVASE